MKIKMKIKKEHSIPIIIFRIISLIIIIIALIFLYNWHVENKKNKSLISEIKNQIIIPDIPENSIYELDSQNETVVEENNSETANSNEENQDNTIPVLDFSNLLNINSDTVAWIRINNTLADFPVVKSQDNNYYLKHNFNKEYNSAGWIFADYRNKFDDTDKNIIIYGHNRRNGSMFSTLNNTLEESWYSNQENQYIILYTPQKTYTYKIFSIYKIIANNFDNRVEFSSDEEFQNFISNSLQNSIYDFGTEVTTKDSILSVYTCANNTKYRIIIQAKKCN